MSVPSVASTILSFLLGFFFIFAGFSKTTSLSPASAELQKGFRSGTWPAMWGLPALPFLYFVGITELCSGLGLWGYVFGVAPQLLAQWAALVPVSICVGAATSHVLNNDPPGAAGFAGFMAVLFAINNFAMAATFAADKSKSA